MVLEKLNNSMASLRGGGNAAFLVGVCVCGDGWSLLMGSGSSLSLITNREGFFLGDLRGCASISVISRFLPRVVRAMGNRC